MHLDHKHLNRENRLAWEANAGLWDGRMADEGNDFANLLCWPVVARLLGTQPGQRLLDIACGNGLFSRRLAVLGARVTAFDFSKNLIAAARRRTDPDAAIDYHVLDATDGEAIVRTLGGRVFDSVLCNMALFDIADIEPFFGILPRLLVPGGAFVFTITHPAFNNASAVHLGEMLDDGGQLRTVYSVKVSRYMTPYQARGLALRGQARPQVYFERPLTYYLELGFRSGFVVDGFEERAFPPGHPQGSDPLSWGGNFSEIPPVVALRMRLISSPRAGPG